MNSKKKNPPKISEWLLGRLLVYRYDFSIIEDFEEEFENIIKKKGVTKARLWYWLQTFHAIRFYFGLSLKLRFNMFKNHLRIALRNIIKNKGYSFLNISGLALGMACAMLILMWVQYELSYDRFHKNANNLYRVNIEINDSGSIWPTTSIPIAPALKEDFPEIVNSARFRDVDSLIVGENKRFNDTGAYVDPSFFSMFTFPFVKGNPETVFNEPFSIVITEKIAKKYFGEEDPLGKTLKVENKNDYRVTGVIKEIPGNSHIRFDFLIPFRLFIQKDSDPGNWGRFQVFSYVQLKEKSSFKEVEQKLTGYIEKHKPGAKGRILRLQPITKIHFYALDNGNYVRYIYVFSMIAIFIIFIACINFMNLSTARSITRGKEVGMRKVCGAQRWDIIKQFMGESILLSFIAFFIAIVLASILLPFFYGLTGREFPIGLSSDFSFISIMIGIVIFTGIIAGSYPAFILSSFRPVDVLRGTLVPVKISGQTKPSLFRKVLVIFQFSISVFLIISSTVIFKQVHFIQEKDIGFDRKQVIYMAMKGKMNQQYVSIKRELLQNTDILNVTATSALPILISKKNRGFEWENKDPTNDILMANASVDYNYIETLGMKIAMGRGFSGMFSTDASKAFIVNETAVREMKIESPIGKRFSFSARDGLINGKIIGVVKDFHFNTLHSEIEPLVFRVNPENFRYICVRIKPGRSNLKRAINFLEDKWKKFTPGFPFEYRFLDESFNNLYRFEQRTGKIFLYFTFIAIFISCLGLFGLASYRVEQGRKEIGIRKVFGASVSNIVFLLSKEFTKWVLISNVISWPVAYLVMNKWLQNFAYQTNFSISVFFLAGIIALIIALFTVSFQSVKAAIANPVEMLRYE